jgi:hypothetical protein
MKTSKIYLAFLGIFLIILAIVVNFVWNMLNPLNDETVDEYFGGIDTLNETMIPEADSGRLNIGATEYGYLTINDIRPQAKTVYPGDVYLMFEEPDYQILYFDQTGEFLITLESGEDYLRARSRAENEFINLVNLPTNLICNVLVDVVIPYYVDSVHEGSYGLSICPNARAVPFTGSGSVPIKNNNDENILE